MESAFWRDVFGIEGEDIGLAFYGPGDEPEWVKVERMAAALAREEAA
jgi:hypothetical protein